MKKNEKVLQFKYIIENCKIFIFHYATNMITCFSVELFCINDMILTLQKCKLKSLEELFFITESIIELQI